MFKVDMDAIRDAALEARLMANPANLANPDHCEESPLAALATLAISQHGHGHIDPAVRSLLEAAMRACEHFQDSQTARIQMVRECLEVPPEQRADLTDYFVSTYPEPRKLR